jgi:hypothetical protein
MKRLMLFLALAACSTAAPNKPTPAPCTEQTAMPSSDICEKACYNMRALCCEGIDDKCEIGCRRGLELSPRNFNDKSLLCIANAKGKDAARACGGTTVCK